MISWVLTDWFGIGGGGGRVWLEGCGMMGIRVRGGVWMEDEDLLLSFTWAGAVGILLKDSSEFVCLCLNGLCIEVI